MIKKQLRLAFAGTPELAANVLEALLSRKSYEITVVYTQPDRPSGRGQKLSESAVKNCARKFNLMVSEPDSAASIDPDNQLKTVDVLIVVAYGLILSAEILNRPRFGCINIHASLLPRWRGAAPIQRAIQAGDTETGVTIMKINTGLDTGPILAQSACSIRLNETAASLQKKLAKLGIECLFETLDKLVKNQIKELKQDDSLTTYATKIKKSEAEINWSLSAIEIDRTIRAFNPAPVAITTLNGHRLRIWEATVIDHHSTGKSPGTILGNNPKQIDVVTGKGTLRLLKIQPPGKRIQSTSEFLNGRPDFLNKKNCSVDE